MKSLSTEGLARRCSRRPWLTIAVWLVILAAAGFITSQYLGAVQSMEARFTGDPDSKHGTTLLEERLRTEPVREIVIVQADTATVDDPAFRDYVQRLTLAAAPLIGDVIEGGASYYITQDSSLVSADRHTTIMPLVMKGDLDDANRNVQRLHDTIGGVPRDDDLRVYTAGRASISKDFREIANRDLSRGELVGAVAALIILIIVFGALVAAGIPLVLAGISIIIALGITAVAGQFFQFEFFVANMITMMGLAVGIDYSLFIVSRFREERALGLDKQDAIVSTGATASRAVLFSGMTVVLALMGMLIVPSSVFRSLGAGAIFVVTVSVLAALTLLPAVLGLLGDRVNSLQLPFARRRAVVAGDEAGGFWGAVTRVVMGRPVISIALAAGLLLAAAMPYVDIKTGQSGVSTLPDEVESKTGFVILEQDFAYGLVTPVEIVVDGPAGSPGVREAVSRLSLELRQHRAFTGEPEITVNEAGDLTLITATMTGEAYSDEGVAAIRDIRELLVPAAFAGVDAGVFVTGEAAINVDLIDITNKYRPIVIGFVLALSFVLLTIVFHSLVVPLKAILMNLLSVGAAYGLLVLVFQKGVGAELLGFQQVNAIETWLPLFLFSILFGLSMDYHVFLLSRIREQYLKTGDNSASVAFGLRSTGSIITGAALIMVMVFSGFASGDLTMFQQIGFGLSVAVFLDVTVVRSVLVPAAMQLLGAANWYLPRWLSWLPDFHVEGGVREERD